MSSWPSASSWIHNFFRLGSITLHNYIQLSSWILLISTRLIEVKICHKIITQGVKIKWIRRRTQKFLEWMKSSFFIFLANFFACKIYLRFTSNSRGPSLSELCMRYSIPKSNLCNCNIYYGQSRMFSAKHDFSFVNLFKTKVTWIPLKFL